MTAEAESTVPALPWDDVPADAAGVLLPGARTAAALAARHAARADAARQLPREVVDALFSAGFARQFAPERLGGSAASFAELMEAVAVVAEGCTSAAWLASLMSQGTRIAGYLPRKGQDEVWAAGDGTMIAVALVARGHAKPVADGWRLSGTWPYVSGAEFADWALVSASSEPGNQAERRFFAVPVAACRIIEDWFTLGMRATGSYSLELADVFVPAHATFPGEAAFAGQPAGEAGPGHRVPLLAISGLTFGAPILGAARAALGIVADDWRTGGDPGLTAREDYARSAGEVEAAGLLLRRVAWSADSGLFTAERTARNTRDSALAVELLLTAVDRLQRRSGTRGQDETAPMQRIWRDVHTASSHGALRFASAAQRFTELRLDIH